jgi:hypothetical protein
MKTSRAAAMIAIRTAIMVLLLALGLATNAHSQEAKAPADGIYLVREKGDGPKVKRNDTGDELVLGKRLTETFGAAAIHSDTNDNSRFRVDLKGAGPFAPGEPLASFALIIGGRCFMVYSHSDRERDGTCSLGSVIHGEDVARSVAKTLNTRPTLRTHPGHRLLVTWTPDKASYAIGEPIMLTLKIKNVGDRPIAFFNGGRQRGARDNQFDFTAFRSGGEGKAVPDTGDPTNFGGVASLPALQPGEVFTKSAPLDSWFKFQAPDTYQITGTYRLEIHDPNESARPHWQDFATGECQVRVDNRLFTPIVQKKE